MACLFLNTAAQGPEGADKVHDPFGVRPKVLPYILTLWFGAQISIEHSTVDKKENGRRLDAWLFIVRKNVKENCSFGIKIYLEFITKSMEIDYP